MSDLRQRIPLIRRAREYHLYAHSGKRYLDLWQNGGHALLGHRPGRLTTVLKDTLSRGLIADLPSVFGGRLLRRLQIQFPGFRGFRVCRSLPEALQLASLYLGRGVAAADVADPLFENREQGEEGETAGSPVSLWRPLLGEPPHARVLIPLLPFSMAGAPVVVCLREEPPAKLPPQAPLSALLLSGLLRSLHDLDRFTLPPWCAPDLLAGCSGWRQEQLYVVPQFPPDRYAEVFEAFLRQQVLLSPQPPYVSILPGGEISGGELRKMVGLFRTYPGE